MLRKAKDLNGYKLDARDGKSAMLMSSTSTTGVGRFDISLPIRGVG